MKKKYRIINRVKDVDNGPTKIQKTALVKSRERWSIPVGINQQSGKKKTCVQVSFERHSPRSPSHQLTEAPQTPGSMMRLDDTVLESPDRRDTAG